MVGDGHCPMKQLERKTRTARRGMMKTPSSAALGGDTLMPIFFDHAAIPVRDCQTSARFLAEILGVRFEADGPEAEFLCVRLGGNASLLLHQADRFESRHLAFRVEENEFHDIVARLRSHAIEFGNDPEKSATGETADPPGERGRVYFSNANGHFIEVIT